jgi:hypothetical protein
MNKPTLKECSLQNLNLELTGRYILIDEQNVKKNNYKIVDRGIATAGSRNFGI